MGRTSTTRTTDNVTNESVKTVDVASETVEQVDENENSKTNKSVNQQPLEDYDEVEVVSLIPNVSYKDSKTGDMYEWDKVGHSEYMTFETLKNMWRNDKGYFRNMWLKPCDNRVVVKFGLTKTYENYEFLMDASNYKKSNIDKICKTISETPRAMKRAICSKIKNLVVNEKISDATVIKKLEKQLNIDLIEFL